MNDSNEDMFRVLDSFLCFILIFFRFLSAPFQRVDKLSASASTFNVACTHYRKQRPAILWYWTSFTALISHKNTILWPQRDTMHRIFQHFWSSWNKKKENIEARGNTSVQFTNSKYRAWRKTGQRLQADPGPGIQMVMVMVAGARHVSRVLWCSEPADCCYNFVKQI